MGGAALLEQQLRPLIVPRIAEVAGERPFGV
ncbi:MAG: hypothetical protein RLY86_3650 [Pseudomonadota bacterium]|jgi:hypothetical protein